MTLKEKVFMLSGNWDVISSAIRHRTGAMSQAQLMVVLG